MPEATAAPPMPDTRKPDDRRRLADSAVRVASRTGTPALTARVAMVPPNAPIPAISVRIRAPPRAPPLSAARSVVKP